MLTILFVLFVIAGFLFHFLATWPMPWAARVAWLCWLLASLLWAIQRVGV